MANSKTSGNKQQQSQLFTLRVWSEQVDDGHVEWRAKLHLISTDESAYFREWAALLPLLLAMLRRAGVNVSSTSFTSSSAPTPPWAADS